MVLSAHARAAVMSTQPAAVSPSLLKPQERGVPQQAGSSYPVGGPAWAKTPLLQHGALFGMQNLVC